MATIDVFGILLALVAAVALWLYVGPLFRVLRACRRSERLHRAALLEHRRRLREAVASRTACTTPRRAAG